MAEETTTGSSGQPSEPSPSHPAKLLRDSVVEAVAAAGPTVRERVKNTLVEAELAKRADMILKGLTKRDEAQKALNKVKPDVTTFNADGSKKDESFSKAKVDELKKAQQALANVDKALEEALSDTPNFEKLSKVVGGGGEKKPEGGEGDKPAD